MTCKQFTSNDLSNLATGNMTVIAAWAVRRHLITCQSCMDEYKTLQVMTRDLQSLATAEASTTIWDGIENSLHLQTTQQPHQERKNLSYKKLMIGSAAAAVLIVGAAFGAKLMTYQASSTFTDNDGHSWHIKTSFNGKILVFAPDGHRVGSFVNESMLPLPLIPASLTSKNDANVVVDSADQHFVLNGIGPHFLKDSQGNSLGTITLSSFDASDIKDMQQQYALGGMPKDFIQASDWAVEQDKISGAACGASGNVYSAYGFDNRARFYWFARGIFTVSMTEPNGTGASADSSIVPPEQQKKILGYVLDPDHLMIPRVLVKNGPNASTLTGYGQHDFLCDDKKTWIRLTVSPRGQQKKSEMIMINGRAPAVGVKQ